MELRMINQALVHILLFISCALLIQCEAQSSMVKSRKSRPVRHLDVLSPSAPSYAIDSPSSLLPPYCVDPPLTPLPPPALPLPPPSPPPPPPPPPPFLYYSPPEFPPNPPAIIPAPPPPLEVPTPPTFIPSPPPPPLEVPTPPTFIPSPPEFVAGPPIFFPPVVYPPPSPTEGTLPGLWCVAKPTVPDPIIQEAMDYACGSGADCDSIEPNGSCYQPDTLLAHASYAFNSYWQRTKVAGGTCDFGGTAILITIDPSYDGCHFNLM